jgi:hypothetical protein
LQNLCYGRGFAGGNCVVPAKNGVMIVRKFLEADDRAPRL